MATDRRQPHADHTEEFATTIGLYVLGVSQAYRFVLEFRIYRCAVSRSAQIIGGYSIDSADATGKERSTIRAITAYNLLIHNYTHLCVAHCLHLGSLNSLSGRRTVTCMRDTKIEETAPGELISYGRESYYKPDPLPPSCDLKLDADFLTHSPTPRFGSANLAVLVSNSTFRPSYTLTSLLRKEAMESAEIEGADVDYNALYSLETQSIDEIEDGYSIEPTSEAGTKDTQESSTTSRLLKTVLKHSTAAERLLYRCFTNFTKRYSRTFRTIVSILIRSALTRRSQTTSGTFCHRYQARLTG